MYLPSEQRSLLKLHATFEAKYLGNDKEMKNTIHSILNMKTQLSDQSVA